MLSISLDGNALITGGGGGIALEIGVSIAQAGAKTIVFADINLEAAKVAADSTKELASNPDYRALACEVNILDVSSIQRMMAFTLEQCDGRLDYAVNAAGIKQSKYKPFGDLDLEEYRRIMAVNVEGVVLCCQAQLKQMERQQPRQHTGRTGSRDIGRGAIINIGSANSIHALPGKVSYTTSKHALIGLGKSAAVDYAKYGIRVNTVCPIWVATRLPQPERDSPDVQKAIKLTTPIGRVAEAEEFADVVAFLLGPSASYINGISLMIDAGISMSVRP